MRMRLLLDSPQHLDWQPFYPLDPPGHSRTHCHYQLRLHTCPEDKQYIPSSQTTHLCLHNQLRKYCKLTRCNLRYI